MAQLIDPTVIYHALVEQFGPMVFIEDNKLYLRCMLCGEPFEIVLDAITSFDYTARLSGAVFSAELMLRVPHKCPGTTITIKEKQ